MDTSLAWPRLAALPRHELLLLAARALALRTHVSRQGYDATALEGPGAGRRSQRDSCKQRGAPAICATASPTLSPAFPRTSIQTGIMTYNNSVITCTPHATPDPFVTFHNGKFYLVSEAPLCPSTTLLTPRPDLHCW